MEYFIAWKYARTHKTIYIVECWFCNESQINLSNIKMYTSASITTKWKPINRADASHQRVYVYVQDSIYIDNVTVPHKWRNR